MGQKLYQHQKNNRQIEELKARFAYTRKQLVDSKRTIMERANFFGFNSNKKNIILIKND